MVFDVNALYIAQNRVNRLTYHGTENKNTGNTEYASAREFLEESTKVNIHLQASEVPKVFTCTATSSSTPQKYIVQKNWRSNFTPKNLETNNFS